MFLLPFSCITSTARSHCLRSLSFFLPLSFRQSVILLFVSNTMIHLFFHSNLLLLILARLCFKAGPAVFWHTSLFCSSHKHHTLSLYIIASPSSYIPQTQAHVLWAGSLFSVSTCGSFFHCSKHRIDSTLCSHTHARSRSRVHSPTQQDSFLYLPFTGAHIPRMCHLSFSASLFLTLTQTLLSSLLHHTDDVFLPLF